MLATVIRERVAFKQGRMWRWRILPSGGGEVLSLRTFSGGINNNLQIWVRIPMSLKSAATGLCKNHCRFRPVLPYIYCPSPTASSPAGCLPVRVADQLPSTNQMQALEATCGTQGRTMNSGESTRPERLRSPERLLA